MVSLNDFFIKNYIEIVWEYCPIWNLLIKLKMVR
jgi:hypothetical protein